MRLMMLMGTSRARLMEWALAGLSEARDGAGARAESTANGIVGDTANRAEEAAGDGDEKLEDGKERREESADEGETGDHTVDGTDDTGKDVGGKGRELGDAGSVEGTAREEGLDEAEDGVGDANGGSLDALEGGAELSEDRVDVEARESALVGESGETTEETAKATDDGTLLLSALRHPCKPKLTYEGLEKAKQENDDRVDGGKASSGGNEDGAEDVREADEETGGDREELADGVALEALALEDVLDDRDDGLDLVGGEAVSVSNSHGGLRPLASLEHQHEDVSHKTARSGFCAPNGVLEGGGDRVEEALDVDVREAWVLVSMSVEGVWRGR